MKKLMMLGCILGLAAGVLQAQNFSDSVSLSGVDSTLEQNKAAISSAIHRRNAERVKRELADISIVTVKETIELLEVLGGRYPEASRLSLRRVQRAYDSLSSVLLNPATDATPAASAKVVASALAILASSVEDISDARLKQRVKKLIDHDYFCPQYVQNQLIPLPQLASLVADDYSALNLGPVPYGSFYQDL